MLKLFIPKSFICFSIKAVQHTLAVFRAKKFLMMTHKLILKLRSAFHICLDFLDPIVTCAVHKTANLK